MKAYNSFLPRLRAAQVACALKHYRRAIEMLQLAARVAPSSIARDECRLRALELELFATDGGKGQPLRFRDQIYTSPDPAVIITCSTCAWPYTYADLPRGHEYKCSRCGGELK